MISESAFKALKKEVRANTLGNGVGYKIKRTGTGTTLEIKPGSGGASAECPFDIKLAPDDTDLIVTFVPGSVNSLLPDNIFDEHTVAASDLTKVKVRATSDGQSITSCTLIVDTSDPEEQTPTPWGLPLSVDILIGVIKEGVAHRTIACGSLFLSGSLQFETENVADPGEPTKTPYFAWVPF